MSCGMRPALYIRFHRVSVDATTGSSLKIGLRPASKKSPAPSENDSPSNCVQITWNCCVQNGEYGVATTFFAFNSPAVASNSSQVFGTEALILARCALL